ncbi:MAG: response regulator [Planctomycetes bacterium]|nr:response regulator [Planctomycetota bacterium]
MEPPIPSNSLSVLVVEDEPKIRRFLEAAFTAQGFRVHEAGDAQAALASVTLKMPNVIILDLGLPGMDGLELTRRLREFTNTPILVLSARGREDDKITALDAGADDYITKPFGVGELVARVRAAIRRSEVLAGGVDATVFESGALKVDLAARRVWVDGADARLTPTEYRLLGILIKNAGKVITHNQLLTEAWGPGNAGEIQYLRVYMSSLRRKIEKNPARPVLLLTETGVGYRLVDRFDG